MFASVIPLKHTLWTEPLWYSISSVWKGTVSPGCLVEVSIGKHIDLGVIAEISWEIPSTLSPSMEIKPILSVRTGAELLPHSLRRVIEILSRQYFIPIHKLASLFLPAPLLTRLDKKNYILEAPPVKKRPQPKRTIHHFVETIFSKGDIQKYWLPETVFILPDDLFLMSLFGDIDEKSTLQVHGELSSVRKAQAWIDIYEAKSKIIIWTRRILYYNLKAYSHIVYIEENFGNEYFQYPSRIRNLDILRALADNSDIDITIITSSPSLDLFAHFRDFEIEAIRT